MSSDPLSRRAEEIARKAHEGQVDKSGRPYIQHPARVAERVKGDDMLEAIAWLHDVVEDTDVTLHDLEQEFPHEIIRAVDAITHRENEPRIDYYQRVLRDNRALVVKVADIADNTDPVRMANLDEETRVRLTKKYEDAKRFLFGDRS